MYVCAVARESGVYFIYVLYKVMLKCLKSCHKLFICAVIAEDVLPPPPSPLPRCRFSIPRSRRASERERIRIYLRAACYFKMIIFIVDHDWGRFRPGAHTHTLAASFVYCSACAQQKNTHACWLRRRLMGMDLCGINHGRRSFYCLLNALTQFSCILYCV